MTPAPTPTARRVVRAFGSAVFVAALAVSLAACSSSKKTETSTDTSAADSSSTTGASSSVTNTTATNASGAPDACALLTVDQVNTVLKGADAGKKQLSQCVWTDGEGTAARLVVSQPKAGSTLDTSGGQPLSGVGDVAVISTAPGSVKISARAKGYQIDFSVDTGTSDIKPNQENAVTLAKAAIANLP